MSVYYRNVGSLVILRRKVEDVILAIAAPNILI